MKSLFSTPAACAALDFDQRLLETAITQKRLAAFIVVANRADSQLALVDPNPNGQTSVKLAARPSGINRSD